ncbi:MAG: hypothetical protein H6Q61_1094 [Firmicutes bacterium]|nr:hypothetical protein [Bacillota bacterium]
MLTNGKTTENENDNEIRNHYNPEENEALIEELLKALNARCEVKTKENAFVCLARNFAVHEGAMTLVADNGALPPIIYNTELKITIRRRGLPPLMIYGQVCGSNNSQWKVDRLRPVSYEESRSYFRQIVSVSAEIICVNGASKETLQKFEELAGQIPGEAVVECRVMDISLEGIRFRGIRRFERGDRLMIRNLFLTEGSVYPFVLMMDVRWVGRTSRNEYMCGCKFVNISQREQDALCSAIFALQREELKAQSW